MRKKYAHVCNALVSLQTCEQILVDFGSKSAVCDCKLAVESVIRAIAMAGNERRRV